MDDLISRQAAIEAVGYYSIHSGDKLLFADKPLRELPTIEHKKGKWIKMSDADGVYWCCSECGEELPRVNKFDPRFDLFPRLKSIDKTNFCPNCGAGNEK